MKRRLSLGGAIKAGRILLSADAARDDSDDAGPIPQPVAPSATQQSQTQAQKQQQQTQQRKLLSNEQLSEMYASVIKLCAQNKVTPQNAWSLKLIDHIGAVLDGNTLLGDAETQQKQQMEAEEAAAAAAATGTDPTGTNFQLASCTLDASALIYSARVDSVHRTAYEVLGGLSHASAKHTRDGDATTSDGEADGEGNADDGEGNGGTNAGDGIAGNGDDDGTAAFGDDGVAANNGDTSKDGKQAKGKGKKASTETAVQTLDTHENLKVKAAEIGAESDALFHKTTVALSAGGCRGLLLNNLSAARGCEIALEPTAAPDGADEAGDAPAAGEGTLDAAELLAMLDTKGRKIESLQICPVFRDPRFNAAATADGDGRGVKSEAPGSEVDLTAEAPLPAPLAISPADGGNGDGCNGDDDDGMMGMGMAGPAFDAEDEDGVSNAADGSSRAVPIPDFGGSGGIAVVDAVDGGKQRSEFTFFDPRMMKNWAGPDHWKFPTAAKPQQKEKAKAGADKADADSDDSDASSSATATTTTSRQKKRARKTKDDALIDFSSPLKIDRKLFDPPAKASTTLSDAALRKHTVQATTLPPDVHYDVAMLSRLFLNPNWRLSERRPSSAAPPQSLVDSAANEAGHFSDSQPQASQEWYEYHNPDENEGDDGAADAAGDGDFAGDMGMDAMGTGTFGLSTGAPASGVPLVVPSAPVISSLVAAPVQPEAVSINYAKAIKRVEVGAVKAALWKAFCRPVPTAADSDAADGGRAFRDLLDALPSLLPQAVMSELTVAFCFVCILHLCNDKGLVLTNRDGELHVSKAK